MPRKAEKIVAFYRLLIAFLNKMEKLFFFLSSLLFTFAWLLLLMYANCTFVFFILWFLMFHYQNIKMYAKGSLIKLIRLNSSLRCVLRISLSLRCSLNCEEIMQKKEKEFALFVNTSLELVTFRTNPQRNSALYLLFLTHSQT